jgi:hypothetical protein
VQEILTVLLNVLYNAKEMEIIYGYNQYKLCKKNFNDFLSTGTIIGSDRYPVPVNLSEFLLKLGKKKIFLIG